MADGAPAPEGVATDSPGPVTAPRGASPALASQPNRELDHVFHSYEENPAPWWLALLWLGFLVGGAAYLLRNLMP